MKKIQYNASNELIKSKFFEMLENAKGRDPKTVDSYVKAIREFDTQYWVIIKPAG